MKGGVYRMLTHHHAKIGIYGIGYHHPGNQPLQQGTILDNPKLLSLYLVSSSGQIVEG